MFKIDENEKLILVIRKHPLYIIIEILILVVFSILPFILFSSFGFLLNIETVDIIYLYMFFYSLFLGILWAVGFVSWTNYYLDMWVLTDKRLISVDQRGLFSREISSLRLDKIQDVKVEVKGIIDTLLHIGSIHVQTAGVEKEFIIHNSRSPNKVREDILWAHNRQIESVKTVRLEEKK
jgi:uncharacterized membrane protein YdbT with pleckstrin-like domain